MPTTQTTAHRSSGRVSESGSGNKAKKGNRMSREKVSIETTKDTPGVDAVLGDIATLGIFGMSETSYTTKVSVGDREYKATRSTMAESIQAAKERAHIK